jgi:hypothetical protein
MNGLQSNTWHALTSCLWRYAQRERWSSTNLQLRWPSNGPSGLPNGLEMSRPASQD